MKTLYIIRCPECNLALKKVETIDNIPKESFICYGCDTEINTVEDECIETVFSPSINARGLFFNHTQVYCTHCIHFRLCDEGIPYCYHENECNIEDCEDSKPYNNRPHYEPKKG